MKFSSCGRRDGDRASGRTTQATYWELVSVYREGACAVTLDEIATYTVFMVRTPTSTYGNRRDYKYDRAGARAYTDHASGGHER